MSIQKIISGIFVICLFVGTAFALSGASTSGTVSSTRWSGGTADSQSTEGGNITWANLSSATLTDRWAAFYGNVSGTINLTNGTSSVYSWTWTPASGGEVCMSEASAATDFGSAMTAAAVATVNTAFTLSSAADNATNTYLATNCTLNFAQATVSSAPYVKHQGSSTFWSCAVNDGAGSGKTDHLFCTNISNTGTSFNNLPVNYEIMVPTTPGIGTETYYFYAEVG